MLKNDKNIYYYEKKFKKIKYIALLRWELNLKIYDFMLKTFSTILPIPMY
jgi:hypothetical protein